VPKVFIETGNMRNRRDARKLESRRFRGRIARGIYEGLSRFLIDT
jgi:N-acetylmuramoyl-L-alanine amidase